MKKEIIIATNNKGKLKELKDILKDCNLISLEESGCSIEVEEDGETFEENAKKKAKEISEIVNKPCIADDSGLCISCLNDWPGVYTGRTIGKNKENLNLILEKLQDIPYEERDAKVVCVIAYYKNGKFIVTKGEVKGKIAFEKRGENGFGFDEIFELDDGRTLAELSSEEKNTISARYIAIKKLLELLTTNHI